jgi:hypothetical protein
MTRARRNRVLGIILLCGITAGCASQKAGKPAATAAQMRSFSAVAIAPLTVQKGVLLNSKLQSEFVQDLQDALAAAGYRLAAISSPPPGTVEVRCSYLDYYPGNQLKYFTLGVPPIAVPGVGTMVTDGSYIPPSLGATVFGYSKATVAVALIDRDSGANIGNLVVTRAIPPNQVGTGTIEPVNKLIQYEVANSAAQAIHRTIKPS